MAIKKIKMRAPGYIDIMHPQTSADIVNFDDTKTSITANNVQTAVENLDTGLSDLAGYVGYADDDIYGVEIDFTNRTFTRIAGAVGKTEGTDFDNLTPWKRRRCNLADDGTVNAYYGEPGYIEDGSNGQVMVEQPAFYYKVVPLKLEKNDAHEIATIAITAPASSSGDVVITLDGVAFNIAVSNGDTANDVATKIRNATYTGWTTGSSSASISFSANQNGAKANTLFSGGATGVTATVTHTQKGYIGRGFKLRKARYYISSTKKAGFKDDLFNFAGKFKDKIYISAYEGCAYDVANSTYILNDAQTVSFTPTTGDKLSSIANAKPISGLTQNLTRRNAGILAENRGEGWFQETIKSLSIDQLLFTVEFAYMNMQTKIGLGVTTKTDDVASNLAESTGQTSSLGNATGMASGTNGRVSVSYRGKENWWGNIYKFVDGINIHVGLGFNDIYIADDNFEESKNTGNYINAEITASTRQGYISAFAHNDKFDWAFIPAETLGDSVLPVGDYFSQNSSSFGFKMALMGGNWDDSSTAGGFFLNVHYAPSTRYRSIGARSLYVPN